MGGCLVLVVGCGCVDGAAAAATRRTSLSLCFLPVVMMTIARVLLVGNGRSDVSKPSGANFYVDSLCLEQGRQVVDLPVIHAGMKCSHTPSTLPLAQNSGSQKFVCYRSSRARFRILSVEPACELVFRRIHSRSPSPCSPCRRVGQVTRRKTCLLSRRVGWSFTT